MKNKLLGFCILVLLNINANAAVIFDNGTNTSGIGGVCSDCGTEGYTVFDSFTLSQDATITSLAFDASFDAAITDYDITMGIWTDAGTGNLFSQTFDLTSASDSSYSFNTDGGDTGDNYTVSLDISDFSLSSGTYWLSLYGTTGSVVGNMNFAPGFVSTDGSMYLVGPGFSSLITGSDMPFRLMGEESSSAASVPEPSVILLMGLGLVGIGFTARKKSKPAKFTY